MSTTTYIDFSPSLSAPFQFGATFDGGLYTVIVTWNLFGQRWYVNIYDTNNTLIVCLPMVGSPVGFNISLTAGYFATQLVWRVGNGQFEVVEP